MTSSGAPPTSNGDTTTNSSSSPASSSHPSSTTPETLTTICSTLHKNLSAFLSAPPTSPLLERVQAQSRTSLDVIHKALKSYPFDELALAFNGGKDCLVLLVLFLAALHSHLPPDTGPDVNGDAHPQPDPRIHSVYVMSAHPFAELSAFVSRCEATYHLDLARYALSLKDAFAAYLAQKPNVRAIFVGTRRTDPHGEHLKHFHRTDHGWPDFERVHPVIDWHYQEIWAFLRALEIPYCVLYDMGYTSLGGTDNTQPNPVLKDGSDHFKPAYELVEDAQERLGREG